MTYKQSNNDFFSYQGTINRKDYAINMLIVIALLIGISLVRFDSFAPYIRPEFLYKVLNKDLARSSPIHLATSSKV